MFKELTKKTFKKCLFVAVIFLIAGAVMVVYSASNVYYTIFGYADFKELEPSQIRSQLVTLDLDTNLGCFMEEYSYNSDTRVKRTTDLYYVIYTGDSSSIDYRLMAIKVPASYAKRMNAITGVTSTPIHFLGKIKKMDKEEYSYFKEAFMEDLGWSEERFKSLTLPYYIDYVKSSTSMGVFFFLLFFGGIALIIAGIYRIVKGKRGGFLKKLREDIQISGYSDSYIESDYAASQPITKSDDIRVGRLMTYYCHGADYRAIPHNKIIWSYQNTTTHRTNGIKTGTTYSVVYHVDGYKSPFDIGVSCESVAQDILRKLSVTCPWVVVGYSDDLKKLYFNNRQEFLQLRYNTMEHNPAETGFDAAAYGNGN